MTLTPDALNEALAGRYRAIRELGAGGMATVYLAHDVRHDRRLEAADRRWRAERITRDPRNEFRERLRRHLFSRQNDRIRSAACLLDSHGRSVLC